MSGGMAGGTEGASPPGVRFDAGGRQTWVWPWPADTGLSVHSSHHIWPSSLPSETSMCSLNLPEPHREQAAGALTLAAPRDPGRASKGMKTLPRGQSPQQSLASVFTSSLVWWSPCSHSQDEFLAQFSLAPRGFHPPVVTVTGMSAHRLAGVIPSLCGNTWSPREPGSPWRSAHSLGPPQPPAGGVWHRTGVTETLGRRWGGCMDGWTDG